MNDIGLQLRECMQRSAPSSRRALSVVSISHSVVRVGAARRRYEALAQEPGLDLTVVVPRVWHEAGNAEHAEPSGTALKVRPEPVRLTRGGPAKWYLHHYPRLGHVLRTLQPDVIHLWEEPWSFVALQAAWLRDRILPKAALLLETDQNIFRRLPFGFEQIRRHTLASTDLLIARSEEALSVSRECGYRGPAEFVEYGIDTTTFYPRRRGARSGGPFRIGYVGRLVPEKGLQDVVAAIGATKTPVLLDLLGEGSEKPVLQAQAQALGVADRIRFHPARNADGVAAFMSSLDAVALMSRTTRTWKEQFGRVIMEAHACGVPVIGSSSGSIPNVVGRGGWIVPEGDSISLAALLDRLAAAPEEVAAVGAAGRVDAVGRFDFSVVSENLLRAWRRAAAVRQGESL
jgi:glycosyltransferase involved in cell wall biosynthesis